MCQPVLSAPGEHGSRTSIFRKRTVDLRDLDPRTRKSAASRFGLVEFHEKPTGNFRLGAARATIKRTLKFVIRKSRIVSGSASNRMTPTTHGTIPTELHRLDVLGTRTLRTLSFRVGDFLPFTQGVETDALEAR